MKKILLPLIIVAGIVAVLSVTMCRRQSYHISEGGVWNTTYRIVYQADRPLDDSIRAVMRQVEMSLSPFNDSSVISRINRNESPLTDSLVRRIFTASQRVNRLSSGAFDPTVAPLVNVWGFGYHNGTGDPSTAEIDSLLTLVGIAECRLAGDTLIKKHEATEFNFSAITKGFGCDMVAAMLRRNGCRNYMVEIGGEIALDGVNIHGRPWRIMVDRPDTTQLHSELAVISPGSGGVATSGNYRNYRVTDDGIVWHTINPVTGRPAPARLLSVTILAPDVMTADALATSCMAMDPDSAMAMISRIDRTEALFVLPDGTVKTSAGFPALSK